MKPAITFSIICLIVAFILSGCGKSNEQIKKVGALQLELFQMQQHYYTQLSELSKVAWQIEAIANRRDQAATNMASDVHAAQGLVAAIFKASEDEGMLPTLENNSDEMAKKLEGCIDKLKIAIDNASVAIFKSREVIVAYNKTQSQKNK
jgi:hypothetical protein